MKLKWPTIKKLVWKVLERRGLSDEYAKRLEYEIKEIEKQSAEVLWIDKLNEGQKYNTNKNGLVLPYLLNLTHVDPLESEHHIIRSTDLPDIDMDCLPSARDTIKEFAARKYGKSHTCSVGTWQTYKLRSAIQDAARGLGHSLKEAMDVTTNLPDIVDELKDDGVAKCANCGVKHAGIRCPSCASTDTDGVTIGQLLDEYDALSKLNHDHPDIIKYAVKMVGKIKAMSKHAGGVIIADRELMGNIPMGISKSSGKKQWTSQWTEGRSAQLSQLGYVKWDVLGLKTLQYIHQTCKLIESTRGMKFDAVPWKNNDIEDGVVGRYFDADGNVYDVSTDDKTVFDMINDLRLETIFQFDTAVQRDILSNGVRNYRDLQIYNAMGHPGPIKCIGSQSRINTYNGLISILNLVPELHKITYVDVNNKTQHTNNYEVHKTGYKKLLKIKTKAGRILYLTSDHIVFTNNGMIEAGNLEIGSKIRTIHQKGDK